MYTRSNSSMSSSRARAREARRALRRQRSAGGPRRRRVKVLPRDSPSARKRATAFFSSRALPGHGASSRRGALVRADGARGRPPPRARSSARGPATSPLRARSGGGDGGARRRCGERGRRGSGPRCTSRSRSRRVAVSTRTLNLSRRWPPTRRTSERSIARRSLGCSVGSRSPISSMRSVPPSACSNRPARAAMLP